MNPIPSAIWHLCVFWVVATVTGCTQPSATQETSRESQPEPARPAAERVPSPPRQDTAGNSQADLTHPAPRSSQETAEKAEPEPTGADCESKGLMVWAEHVDPETGKAVPRCGIRFETVESNDKNEANVVGRMRSLVIEPGRTREEIGELLQWYYGQMRAELSGMDKPNKQIFVYAYDDRKRVTAGFGEWQGMIQAIATDGAALPEQAVPQFKLPPAGAKKPSAREEMIYDALMQEFAKNAGSEDEDATMKRVAKRYKMTTKELDALYLKVTVYRNSGS